MPLTCWYTLIQPPTLQSSIAQLVERLTVNQFVPGSSPGGGVLRFKALVHVRLRGSVSDAAGNAVMKNTHMVAPNLKPHLLRIGKAIDFWFDADTEEIAREEMDLLSDRMLSNTVIEDWEYTLEETEETGIGNISNDNAGTSKHSLFDQ